MGVIRRGVDAPEAANAGILAFLLRNEPLGDETPAKEEALPEIELPGFDPFDIVRVNGVLPEKGLLLGAKMARGGNAVFTIYYYDNLEQISLDEQGKNGEYQYLQTTFGWSDDSKAREIEFSYEQPNYFDKDTQPHSRVDSYNYMKTGFDKLDIVPLADDGRLLISKVPRRLGNSDTRLDQTPWKNNLPKGQVRNLVRWFPAGEVEKLGEAIGLITGVLLGINADAVEQITENVKARLRIVEAERE